MSIMNDAWIIQQSTPPTHLLFSEHSDNQPAWADLTHPQERLDDLCKRYHATVMTDKILESELGYAPMITPFESKLVRAIEDDGSDVARKVISFGVSSYGYDVRLAEEFKIFTNANGGIIDPKRFDEETLLQDGVIRTDQYGDRYVILPPNSYLLGRTVEYFDIPRDTMVVCLGKSTYARAGAIVNVTPIEAGFKGNVVIEIGNSTTLPLKIYVGEGCAQFLFFKGNAPCLTSYADRGGKYMGQSGITLSKV